ncbi:O-methyltransferase [bacterium]|nr:O-methyltransferase [bacterium]
MFEDLKEYASLNKVPIIKDEGLEFLLEKIKEFNVKSVLEIGTAIGYSAIRMAFLGVNITTLERDEVSFIIAKENIKKYNLEDKIEPIHTDALLYTPEKSYDLIFIDAAKAQNKKFFLRFSPYLSENGIIIVDNLLFHGLTDKKPEEIKSKNLRSLIKKINEFKEWLISLDSYKTIFTNAGDGMSLSIKL